MAAGTEPRKQKAGFSVWAEYKTPYRDCVRADTGKGNGNDHSVSVLIATDK